MTKTRSFNLQNWWDPSSWSTETTRIEAGGTEWNSVYEKASNAYTETSPSGHEFSTEFDDQMNIVGTRAAGVVDTDIDYDSAGRVSSASAGEREATFRYDVRGNLAEVTDATGRSAVFEYDAADRVVSEQLPGGRTIQYTYDAAGNVSTVRPPSRPTHQALYDLLGRTTSTKSPTLGSSIAETTYEYNGADNEMTKMTRPSGRTVNLEHDSAGRVSRVATAEGDYVFTFNESDGQLASAVSADGQTADLEFDGGLITSMSQSGVTEGQVSLSYDSLHRLTQLTAPGITLPLTYDQDSLLSSTGDMTLQRSAATGFVAGTTIGNTSSSLTYNQYGETSASQSSFPNGGHYNESYVRDAVGRITEKTVESANGTDQFEYAYDPAGRLTSVAKNGAVQASYSFDANSNRTTTTYSDAAGSGTFNATFDDRDRMTTYGDLALSYNEDGELTRKENTETGAITSFTYSTLGAIRNATLPDGQSLSYDYDAFGNLIAKKENGLVEQGFLYAPGSLSPVAELDAAGDSIANFIHATRSTVPDYMAKDGRKYRIITDQIGSVKLVVDVESGSIEQAIEYDAFGRVLSDSNPGFQPFGFAGGIYDRDTKLTHFGVREYDAEIGRWTSSDPIQFAGGDANLYAYVLGDPVNLLDPTGLYGVGDAWNDFTGTIGEMPNVAWDHRGPILAAAGVGACAVTLGAACVAMTAAAALNAIGTGAWQAAHGCWGAARGSFVGGLLPPGARTAANVLNHGHKLLEGTFMQMSEAAKQAQRLGVLAPAGATSGLMDEINPSFGADACGC